MHELDVIPVINATAVFRAAVVSEGCGRRTLRELAEQGRIHPVRTPTGRTMLSPVDGRLVFDVIREGRPA